MKIKGTNKDDRLYGTKGDDIIKGKKGADYLNGGDGNDVLKGGRGNDTLYGHDGTDKLIGGKGRDTFIVNTDSFDIIKDYNPDKDRVVLNNLDGTTNFDFDLTGVGYDGSILSYEGVPVAKVSGLILDADHLFVV